MKMQHGSPRRDVQYPPQWEHSETLQAPKISPEERMMRAKHIGNHSPFEYCIGHNFVFVTGKVTRKPRLVGSTKTKQTWFRMCVPNQDLRDQKLFLTVRCKNELGLVIMENLQIGDIVAVVGQTWTAKPGSRRKHPVNYLLAERISSPFPVAIDSDPRFVRVRWDLWNRIVKIIGRHDLRAVPPRARAKLLEKFAEYGGLGDDPTNVVDDEPLNPKASP